MVRLAGGAVVAPGLGIHVTVGLKACVLPVVLAPISDFLVPSNPGDYPLHSLSSSSRGPHASDPSILTDGGAT